MEEQLLKEMIGNQDIGNSIKERAIFLFRLI